jgi:hypothetical protein
MSDKRYRVRWKATNCSGYFNRTFEDKEDAEMFAQGWLLDCMDGILDGFDYGDSYTYEVIGFFPLPVVDDAFDKMHIDDAFDPNGWYT